MAKSDRCRLDLGNGRYLVAEVWNDQPRLNIREYEEGVKCGISLTLQRFDLLRCAIPDIDQALADVKANKAVNFRFHLGGNVYVSVSNGYSCVDVRQFWIPPNEDELTATRKGIALKLFEWERFKSAAKAVDAFVPELISYDPCFLQLDHSTEEGTCKECNPNRKD